MKKTSSQGTALNALKEETSKGDGEEQEIGGKKKVVGEENSKIGGGGGERRRKLLGRRRKQGEQKGKDLGWGLFENWRIRVVKEVEADLAVGVESDVEGWRKNKRRREEVKDEGEGEMERDVKHGGEEEEERETGRDLEDMRR